MKYQGEPDYRHDDVPRTGVLLVNLGTPDAPDTGSVRRYLREFLSDPRVIEAPRLLWWFALRVILLIRPGRSAAAYRKIWRDDGSPLLTISRQQTDALRSELGAQCKGPISVQLAMRYGRPSIAQAMENFRANGVRRLLVLPMYPQYCAATTASAFDALADELKRTRWLPELRFIAHYHDEAGYIQALANSVKEYWQANGRGEKLLLSFHGIPQRYLDAGDPYHCECHKTARLLAEKLELSANDYQVSFQSRVGREPWLHPYTDETLTQLAEQGVKTVDVICPGFSADCLETLEEIEMQNAERFIDAGGVRLAYIPALNARDDHIRFLAELCKRHLQGWPESSEQWSKHKVLEQAERAIALARRLGAQQ